MFLKKTVARSRGRTHHPMRIQELFPADFQIRLNFRRQLINLLENDHLFIKKIFGQMNLVLLDRV